MEKLVCSPPTSFPENFRYGSKDFAHAKVLWILLCFKSKTENGIEIQITRCKNFILPVEDRQD